MAAMNRRTMLQLGGSGAVAAGLGGCSLLGLYYGTWNFLWTVTVKTKDGPKSGSAVYQISLQWPGFPARGSYAIKQAGVSPVIDLGDRGWLIVLARVDIAYLPDYDQAQVPPGAFNHQVDVLTGLPFVRFTYMQGEIGWHGGKEWPKGEILAYASSALSWAKKVRAPADGQPVFAYAPRDVKALTDVKAYWAYEFPQFVGPDVTYLESTLEPTSQAPSSRLALNADWYDRARTEQAPHGTGYLMPAPATNTRYVSIGLFGELGM